MSCQFTLRLNKEVILGKENKVVEIKTYRRISVHLRNIIYKPRIKQETKMTIVFEQDFKKTAQEVLTEIGNEKFDFDAVQTAEKRLREIITANSPFSRCYKEQLVRYAMFFGECFSELFGAKHFLDQDGDRDEMFVGFGSDGCYINTYDMVLELAHEETFSITSLFHYVKVMLNKKVFLSKFDELDFDKLYLEKAA